MTTPPAHFQRRLYSVLQQEVLKLQQIFHRSVIVCVDGDPL